jgi:hypothetical protein
VIFLLLRIHGFVKQDFANPGFVKHDFLIPWAKAFPAGNPKETGNQANEPVGAICLISC